MSTVVDALVYITVMYPSSRSVYKSDWYTYNTGFSRMQTCTRAWYLFSCDYDMVKIGQEFLEQKGNVLSVYAFDARCVVYSLPDS